MLSNTVRQGRRRASWNTYPSRAGRPASVTDTVPLVGVSTPERMLSSVLFPHPEGPTMETKTFPSTSRLMSPMAVTG